MLEQHLDRLLADTLRGLSGLCEAEMDKQIFVVEKKESLHEQ